MEYTLYVLAALIAGIGTGFAGMSNATIMVPILIVMCPSFGGELGAYQATAIALASDVLGSAVTSIIYISNKNIDIKRGWIMAVCILVMCIAGSFVASLVGNIVLGGFSLFLCVAIGIRFLLKPDMERRETSLKGTGLGLKGIAISIFFGVMIGFGVGFVGSGGGMMMLVVFTMFLGLPLKPSVGTSTLIMAMASLIAAMAHMTIEPSIILERWDALIISVAVATTAAAVSARFANKVENRTVGLVTGTALTVIGTSLILLNYWGRIIEYGDVIFQTFISLAILCAILAVQAAIIICIRSLFKNLPKEMSRKLLQIPALSVMPILVYVSDRWVTASLAAILFALLFYPILSKLEGNRLFNELTVQRKPGEVKKSLLLMFFTDAVLIAVCWGLLKLPYIAVTSVLIWGVSDSVAALVGKKYGKHHISLPFADNKKTWEGSSALAITSLITGTIFLTITSGLSWYMSLLVSAVATPFAIFSEMFSHNGNDTVACPVIIATALYLMSFVV